MKKILFLAAMTAAMLTSCSNDEVIESGVSENSAISFQTTGQKAMTRSVVTSLSNFYVSAITSDNATYFYGQNFTLNGGIFSSSTPYYWPTGKTLDFYATNQNCEFSLPAAASNDYDHDPVIRYEVEADGDNDAVMAVSLNASKQTTVPLTFKHILTRIGVKVTSSDNDNNLTYVVKSVKFPVYTKATYDIFSGETSGQWADIDNDSYSTMDYCNGSDHSFTGGNSWTCSEMYNIIPAPNWHPSVTIEYQILQNGQVIVDKTGDDAAIAYIDCPSEGWTQGSCFNFVFYLSNSESGTPIQFSSTVTSWDETADDDYNL